MSHIPSSCIVKQPYSLRTWYGVFCATLQAATLTTYYTEFCVQLCMGNIERQRHLNIHMTLELRKLLQVARKFVLHRLAKTLSEHTYLLLISETDRLRTDLFSTLGHNTNACRNYHRDYKWIMKHG